MLRTSLDTGIFYRFSQRKRSFLLTKFHKLTRRVNELQWQMKLAAFGGTVAALTNTQDATAQSKVGPFVLQNRAHNPLRWPMRESELKPTAVDLDNDGDYDIVAGEDFGYIRIYLNEGTPERPGFTEYYVLDDGGNPIQGYGGAPAFADLTGDGNLDLIFAQHEAYPTDEIRFYVGNGGIPGDITNPLLFTEQNGSWDDVNKTGNPFESINGYTVGTNLTLAFVNFDGDGDQDALIGHAYSEIGDGLQVHYYENDGDGNFSLQPFGASVGGTNDFYRATPQLADIDGDGADDLIVGRDWGDLLFFKGDGAGNFTQQFGGDNPLNGVILGTQSAPAFVDLDNDGDLDLVMGYKDNKYAPYFNNSPLAYFENIENTSFEEKDGFLNPFDGIELGYAPSSFFVDLDGDGDLEAVLGSKYDFDPETTGDNNGAFHVYENLGGSTGGITGTFGDLLDDPIQNINALILDDGSYPQVVNLDGDADLEVVAGTVYDGILYFDLEDGVYVERTGAYNPFDGIGGFDNNLRPFLVDIDNDGDLDLFLGGEHSYPYRGSILFFENTGSASAAEFTQRTGTENPLNAVDEEFSASAYFYDIDHDGDFDAMITESGLPTSNGNNFLVMENQGTSSEPLFLRLTSHPLLDISFPIGRDYENSVAFVDIDEDGDLDMFLGISDGNPDGLEGQFAYYKNDNPVPVTTLATTALNYSFTGGPLAVDANLTLSDSDSDLIVRATVAIQSYQPGNESLSFTTQAPITGSFDNTTGILTLQGKASLAVYQSVLRTVTYTYSGPDPGARKGNAGKVKAVSRTIAFATFDEDLTTPGVTTRSINVASSITNQPPVVSPITISTVIQGSASIDLAPFISDSESNFDPNTTGALSIVSQPQSGAPATISGTILSIDYTGLSFSGNDTMRIQVCDIASACTTVDINITVAGEIVVYNGISPNGDGLNDFFRLDNITALGPENNVKIFNRWGDKVFEIDNYDNSSRRFEGVSDDGKDLSSGVYFYKIEFTNGRESLEGYLTLKR